MDYIKIESENQKSGLIILLVLFHSACPYKNYCLKCFTELQTLFIYLFIYLSLFFFYLVTRDQLTKQKKKLSQETHLAAVFDCRTVIVGYYNVIIIIQLACAYNVDDLYHTGRIDLPGMEKVVYIVCAYYTYVHRICTWLLDSRKAWAANIAIEWLPCTSI